MIYNYLLALLLCGSTLFTQWMDVYDGFRGGR